MGKAQDKLDQFLREKNDKLDKLAEIIALQEKALKEEEEAKKKEAKKKEAKKVKG